MEELNPQKAIEAEVEARAGAEDVGMLTLRTANRTLREAALRPDPRDLYWSLWYEGEVCCLFADSNLGKSIYAVQMADEIAHTRNVLYVDCELSDKQFQLRYTDPATGVLHSFPDSLVRAEINPAKMDMKDFEQKILADIEAAANKTASRIIIIDNLTYLCNASDKGDVAGRFMMSLMNLKFKYGWSLLIIAHTPKRNLSSPITQNDLAGSKKLYNFFDSCFAIGKSGKDERLRYVKQVKVRAGAYQYGADNVLVYEIVHEGDYAHFAFRGFASEAEHLKEKSPSDHSEMEEMALKYHQDGKSVRHIADLLGVSKSTIARIIQKAKVSQPVPVSQAGDSGTLRDSKEDGDGETV